MRRIFTDAVSEVSLLRNDWMEHGEKRNGLLKLLVMSGDGLLAMMY